ncbi:MAG: hypothetical protein ACTTJW_01345 [Sphaerochaeta sp.]
MKKVIIVLLITVLVAGFAFAGKLSGTAGISFGVDLDKKEWGFKNNLKSTYVFSFELDKTTVGKDAHETDVWAEVAAEASAAVELESKNKAGSKYDVVPEFSGEVKITKANIHVGDITFGILNAGSAADFAKHYQKAKGLPIIDVVNGPVKADVVPGFTVSYDGYTVGLGAKGSWGPEKHTVFAHVETKEFKVAEDAVTVQAGAYGVYSNESARANYLGASAKAGYKADKLSADVAADLKYDNKNVIFDAALNVKYDFLTLNAYMGPGALADYKPADEPNRKDPYTGTYANTLLLDAKLKAEYTFKVQENLAVGVEGSVELRDALLPGRDLTVGAKASCDAGIASAYVQVDTMFVDFALANSLVKLPLKVGVESEKVVENAKLALVYNNPNLIAKNKGSVTASATIKF